jgi:hypothetical protein
MELVKSHSPPNHDRKAVSVFNEAPCSENV